MEEVEETIPMRDIAARVVVDEISREDDIGEETEGIPERHCSAHRIQLISSLLKEASLNQERKRWMKVTYQRRLMKRSCRRWTQKRT